MSSLLRSELGSGFCLPPLGGFLVFLLGHAGFFIHVSSVVMCIDQGNM